MPNLAIRALRRVRREFSLIPDRWAMMGPFSRTQDRSKPRVVLNSIPKSGTYFLGKLATMLGLYDLNIHILDGAYWDYNRSGTLHKWKAVAEYTEFANPRLVQQPTHQALRRILPGQFAVAHIGRTSATVEAIRDAGLKQVFIYRDPRDVILSYARFVTNRPDRNPNMIPHEYFTQVLTTDEERIAVTIAGQPGVQPNMLEYIFHLKPEWLDDPETCCVRFEDLVGDRGGGSAERQREAVSRILSYLEIEESDALYEQIASELHGGQTHTFNKGQIGEWREAFSASNIQLFKETAGDLLIRLGYETDDNW